MILLEDFFNRFTEKNLALNPWAPDTHGTIHSDQDVRFFNGKKIVCQRKEAVSLSHQRPLPQAGIVFHLSHGRGTEQGPKYLLNAVQWRKEVQK